MRVCALLHCFSLLLEQKRVFKCFSYTPMSMDCCHSMLW